jgi:hypothetical protein
MDDKTILEACARATWGSVRTDLTYAQGVVVNGGQIWNPLADDGDCFRMETKCGVTLVQMLGASPFVAYAGHTKGFTPGNDAERRRASCLVVARAQLAKELV